jgi:hypothetical protein
MYVCMHLSMYVCMCVLQINKYIHINTGGTAEDAINSALYLPPASRGHHFQGVLRYVYTPFGHIDITASGEGLSWKWSIKEGSYMREE